MDNSSFFSLAELSTLPFKHIGNNVLVSRKASIYNPEQMSIGDNVRIDDFCILSGKIKLGDYIHISAYCALYGAMGIELGDFSGLSPGCKIFSASDDFSGESLVGPMLPDKFTNVTGGEIIIGRYVQVGAGSIIFPNLEIEEGAAIGAMSLITTTLKSWNIYTGIPAVFMKARSKKILELVSQIKP